MQYIDAQHHFFPVFSRCLLLLGCGKDMTLDGTVGKICWQWCLVCGEELWIITLGICQLNISHFQDIFYWAMSWSDCGICRLSFTVFRTLFTERRHQVTAICQQTISHFQVSIYCTMPSRECHSCLPFRSSRHPVWAPDRPFCLKFVVIYFSTCSEILV